MIDFCCNFPDAHHKLAGMTIESFKCEIADSVKVYDQFIVCLGKTTEDFEASLNSLMTKAIKAYETRGEGLRHGIALDRQVTVILSQGDGPLPLCGIYFNLHSPYQKHALKKPVKPLAEKSSPPQN
jgi:cobalamin biosynthesis protein CbiD